MVNTFSKYVCYKPVNNKTGKEVTEALKKVVTPEINKQIWKKDFSTFHIKDDNLFKDR